MLTPAEVLTPAPLTGLVEIVSPAAGDLIYIVAGGISKKVKFSNVGSAGGGTPEDLTFAYIGGVVSGINFSPTGRDLAFTYNSDGTVATVVDDGDGAPPANTKTFAYNVDGTVATVVVT